MAEYLIKDTTLTNIANAIREKTDTTTQISPEDMPDLISNIKTGSNIAVYSITNNLTGDLENINTSTQILQNSMYLGVLKHYNDMRFSEFTIKMNNIDITDSINMKNISDGYYNYEVFYINNVIGDINDD